jgi:hypothetical protein
MNSGKKNSDIEKIKLKQKVKKDKKKIQPFNTES